MRPDPRAGLLQHLLLIWLAATRVALVRSLLVGGSMVQVKWPHGLIRAGVPGARGPRLGPGRRPVVRRRGRVVLGREGELPPSVLAPVGERELPQDVNPEQHIGAERVRLDARGGQVEGGELPLGGRNLDADRVDQDDGPGGPTRSTSAVAIGSMPSACMTSGETAEWFAPVSMTAVTCTAGTGGGPPGSWPERLRLISCEWSLAEVVGVMDDLSKSSSWRSASKSRGPDRRKMVEGEGAGQGLRTNEILDVGSGQFFDDPSGGLLCIVSWLIYVLLDRTILHPRIPSTNPIWVQTGPISVAGYADEYSQ